MKITGGAYRNRKVEARDDRSLRPTTSKVREAIFNLLRHGKFRNHEDFEDTGADILEGQNVIDIFCGSGILGLEAASRGAEHVTLIDRDSKTVEIAKHNVRHLNANAKVIRSDSTQLPKARQKCGLAFVDPPYSSKMVYPALKSLRDQGWLTDGAVIIVEHGKTDDVSTPPEGYKILDSREYNKTKLTVMQYKEV